MKTASSGRNTIRTAAAIIRRLFLLLVLTFTGCENRYDSLDLSPYQYRDTRNLVKFTYDASQILKRDGMKSLGYFHANYNLYRTPDYYLYIYDIEGNNLFHAGMPALEGKNLLNFSDINGKKVIQLVLKAVTDPDNPHGWVHYFWWAPGKFYPVPKSSVNFLVKTPDGKQVFVGAGIDYPHEEKEFVRISVDGAVSLIASKGIEAIPEIADPKSSFNYRDVRVFAFYPDGTLLISPVYDENPVKLKILECQDEVGNKPFANAVKRLQQQDRVWEVFMEKNRYQRELVKKCLYLRKTMISGKEIYIGAISNLPLPP
ncbi:MAG: calcium:proton antiporter [Chlorobiaceae bacterium]|nr:calcium:proton antiporter [Chlorobiaceae bacterium]